MARVTGIGGFFFRARDPEAFNHWISTDPETPIECPVAIVVNRGHYTITRLGAHSRRSAPAG